MPITLLPTAPSRASPTTFAALADAYVSALTAMGPEINVVETNVNNKEASATASALTATTQAIAAAASAAAAQAFDNATGTSTTSIAISIANGKVFATQSGKSWVAGMPLIAYNTPGNYMLCTVASYTSTTLTLDCYAIVGSGTVAVWSFYTATPFQFPIFAAGATSLAPVGSATGFIQNSIQTTTLGAVTIQTVIFGNSLFIAATNSASSNVSTSPDGITWTSRAMGSSQVWQNIGTNGTDKFVAVNGSGATVAKSTDGTTWTAGGATPGAVIGPIVFVSATGCILASAASTCYTTADNGATWGSQTLPTTNASAFTRMYSLNGTFVFVAASLTQLYTSATGATGSWTVRATGFTITNSAQYIYQDFDGALIAYDAAAVTLRRTTDGINWTDLGFLAISGIVPIGSINGVYFWNSSTYSYTRHNGKIVQRTTDPSAYVSQAIGTFGTKNTTGSVFVLPNGASSAGKIIRIAPADADAAKSFFSQ